VCSNGPVLPRLPSGPVLAPLLRYWVFSPGLMCPGKAEAFSGPVPLRNVVSSGPFRLMPAPSPVGRAPDS
jgi:hypothetical protein